MKHTLEFETTIECRVQELFDFHADTHNLPLITPPDIQVEIIKLDEPLKQGNEAVLKIKKGLIGFVWELVFEQVTPNLIVDRAMKSPFKSFVHAHHFIKVDEKQTLLKDVITFELPLAPLSNPVAWFIKHDMKKMFIYRHQKTLEYFA
ncbi:MAG: hypothetical protein JXQ76_00920 [Campylobacterales bacterium]|nr:hypothetical protein [Campylobacterales bacterium]